MVVCVLRSNFLLVVNLDPLFCCSILTLLILLLVAKCLCVVRTHRGRNLWMREFVVVGTFRFEALSIGSFSSIAAVSLLDIDGADIDPAVWTASCCNR